MTSHIIAVLDDLFFASKIRATAQELGVEVRFARSADAALEAARAARPTLLIVDLHAMRFEPFELARRLKADEKLGEIQVIGFFSHVQTALQRQALESGYDRVLPRSAFSRQLHEILRAHA